MENNLLLIVVISMLIITHIFSFALGLLLGYNTMNSHGNSQTPTSFLKNKGINKKDQNDTIQIDDTKVVLNLNTDGMEKKYTEIGKEIKSKNDIEKSVSKLKSMKGK